jgi:trehalose 6-phosphate phosphatase
VQLGAKFSDRDMDITAPPHLSDLRNRAILLDIDGTILDIAPSPRQVWVPTGLRRILSRLAELTDGALALVSGRSLNDIDLIFSPLQLAAIGGHGVEIRTAAHAEPQIQLGSLSTTLKRQLAAVAELGPGILVEDKGYSLALHYRLAPEQGQALLAAVTDICATVPQGMIEMLPGKMVVEIKPAGVTKATAVCELMSYPPFLGRHPVFIGDDTTDVPVFGIIPKFGGLAYSVGRIIADVDGHFDRPETVRSWLARIAAEGQGAAE